MITLSRKLPRVHRWKRRYVQGKAGEYSFIPRATNLMHMKLEVGRASGAAKPEQSLGTKQFGLAVALGPCILVAAGPRLFIG